MATPLNTSGRIDRMPVDGLDEALIRTVVERFYAAARQDDVVGPIFMRVIADDRWQHHLDTIVDFWSSALLGTGRYEGRPMPKHMAIPELGDAHFRRWLALFRLTVEEACPPDIAALFIDRSERIANSFRLNIRMRRGDDIAHLRPLEREVLGAPRNASAPDRYDGQG